MVIEAKKSHILLSASWGTGKAGGVIQFESADLRIGANGVSLCLRLEVWEPGVLMSGVQEETDIPAQQEGANSPFLCLLIIFGPSMDWIMPTYIGEDIFFTESTDSNANLFQKDPHRRTQKWHCTSSLCIP